MAKLLVDTIEDGVHLTLSMDGKTYTRDGTVFNVGDKVFGYSPGVWEIIGFEKSDYPTGGKRQVHVQAHLKLLARKTKKFKNGEEQHYIDGSYLRHADAKELIRKIAAELDVLGLKIS